MSLAKNVYNKEVPTRNLVTTISGVIVLVVTLLVTIGVLTQEQGTILSTQLGIAATAVQTLIGVISSIILVFKAVDPPADPVV